MDEHLQLRIERTFDAPIQKVWEAWTKPGMLRQWSCPETFEVTEQSGDLQVGGTWTETMVSEQYSHTGKLKGEYKIIEPPHKLVSTHEWVDGSGNDGKATEYTLELSELDGKTHMTFTQVGFVSKESRDSHKDGWSQTIDKLSEYLL